MTKKGSNVGKVLKKYRNTKGLTLKNMGEKLGITYQQYQRYEKGITPPPFDRLEKIIHLLEIPPTKLFNNEKIVDSIEQFEKKVKKYSKILELLESDPKLMELIKVYSTKSKKKK